MRFRLERVIAAPLLSVFEFFSDPRNRPRWQRTLRRVEMLTPGEPGLGTRWKESPLGLGTVELEITVFDPPRRWAERGQSPMGRLELTLMFEPIERSTRVDLDANLEVPMLLRVGLPLVAPLMRREFQHDVDRAARLLESSSSVAGSSA